MAEKQFKIGDKVTITFGVFTGHSGTIEQIDNTIGVNFPYGIMINGHIYGYSQNEFVLAK